MPADSGHSIDMTNEAGDTLPAFMGDTPDPTQGLQPVESLLESTDLALTPIPDPVTPSPEFVVEEIGEIGVTPNPAQGLPSVGGRPLAPIHLANAATQLPYGSGEMKGEGSPLHIPAQYSYMK